VALRRARLRIAVLRFRELDDRARQALATMLRSLAETPAPALPAEEPPWSPEAMVEEIGRLLGRAGPLESRLAHYAARLERDAELTLVLRRPSGDDGDRAALDSDDRVLARVRRVGPESFTISAIDDSLVRDLDPPKPRAETDRNG
jgi:hypothetical protein